MESMVLEKNGIDGIDEETLKAALEKSLAGFAGRGIKKALIIPPDYTRLYSGAGKITAWYYELLKDTAHVDIMPAVGTHETMSEAECAAFFEGRIPYEKLIAHNWRTDVVKLGEVPASFVTEVSEGLVDTKIDVEVNRLITDPSYDIILSVGQVVPHEVVGMANYSKNIFVGAGGSSMISSSHILGAYWGTERLMGKDHSPVRKVFDYAEEHFLNSFPIVYVLTVTTVEAEKTRIHGLYIGRERALFEKAVRLSQQKNITYVDKPLKKVVAYLDGREFKSTWVGNKSIYRTRMAIAEGGELIVLAPGVRKFGEDEKNDELIRKYGYVGRENVLRLVKEKDDLKNNLSVAAHLIHGSNDGHFSVTYCTEKISEAEVRGVNFNYAPYQDMAAKYNPALLRDGYNTVDGEEIYYVSNPALGLWMTRGGGGET